MFAFARSGEHDVTLLAQIGERLATLRTRTTLKGRKRYQAIIRLRGFPPVSATFDREHDRRRWVQITEAQLREHRHFGAVEERRRTLAETVKRWEREAAPLLKSRAEAVDRSAQLAWWCAKLGDLRLGEITSGRIAELREELARGGGRPSGRTLSGSTVNRYLAALSRVLSLAADEWGWMQSNPVKRVSRRRESAGRMRILTEEERARLLSAASDPLLAMIELALSTGMRQGEIEALRWPDIDLARRVAFVRDPKNREPRSVPLSGVAVETLARLSRVRRISSDRVLPVDFDKRVWARVLRAAGIEGLRFHDLRHTAASYLAMSGATLLELAQILGHKTLAMVKRYAHFYDSHLGEVSERMARKFLA
jgi:integrase